MPEEIKLVEQGIVQNRKGLVDNKWVKHGNHTYYEPTEKGKAYLGFYCTHSG